MKTKFKVFAAAGIILAIVSLCLYQTQALAHEQGRAHARGLEGEHGGWSMKKMMSALGLSEEQKQTIKEIRKENQPLIQPLVKQLTVERRALRALLQAETIDEAAIRAQAAKVAALQADMAVERAHIHQAVRKVLNPEQLQKFKELQAERDRKFDDFLSRKAKRFEGD